MKIKLPLLALSIALSCLSCKKCRVCTCESSSGAIEESRNCAIGGGSSLDTQKKWEQMLRNDCPQLQCKTED